MSARAQPATPTLKHVQDVQMPPAKPEVQLTGAVRTVCA